jgi:hypothetical protein
VPPALHRDRDRPLIRRFTQFHGARREAVSIEFEDRDELRRALDFLGDGWVAGNVRLHGDAYVAIVTAAPLRHPAWL